MYSELFVWCIDLFAHTVHRHTWFSLRIDQENSNSEESIIWHRRVKRYCLKNWIPFLMKDCKADSQDQIPSRIVSTLFSIGKKINKSILFSVRLNENGFIERLNKYWCNTNIFNPLLLLTVCLNIHIKEDKVSNYIDDGSLLKKVIFEAQFGLP